MVRQHELIRASALTALVAATALGAGPTVRREEKCDFEPDPAFEADGGVQIFFELVNAEALPATNPHFQAFQVLDRGDRWGAATEPLHVAMVKLSYVVEKDVSFFSASRLLDLGWVQTIAPDMNITSQPDGGFLVGRTPANHFTLDFHADASFAPDVARLAKSSGAPVLVQENTGFARVMGWRTGDWSATWTFHERLAAGKTRVTVLTLSYLFNVPPFFLGGEARVFRETVEHAVALISRLRAFHEDAASQK
ncbi:MAG: hypothetical protein U0228_30110 [Myxococcaceae bacterium]